MSHRRFSSVGRPPIALLISASLGLVLASCGSGPGGSPISTPTALPTPAPSPSPHQGPTFDVATYGATGDGTSDNAPAFARAISAADSAGGGTVYVPAGKYIFNSSPAPNPASPNPASIIIQGAVAITLQGAGRDQTSLIEARQDKGLLSVFTDHTVISDLTLDTQTHAGGAVIFVRANYTALLRTRALGGSQHFALYYAGPAGAQPLSPAYNLGNTVNDLQLNDLVCDDGFSWSFQKDSTISNVVHTGSRLALYVDEATTVTGYQYTPGSQQCDARDGFWLTPPADGITIINFVSSGDGGKVGVTGRGGAGKVANDVTIIGLKLTGNGYRLSIGDVRNLVLQGCNLGDNTIVIVAQAVAEVTLSGCTYARLVRRSAPGALVVLSVRS